MVLRAHGGNTAVCTSGVALGKIGNHSRRLRKMKANNFRKHHRMRSHNVKDCGNVQDLW